jgi:murein DD-endopeptidase
MKINWEKIWGNERAQWDKMTPLQKYQYFLLLQYGSPYGWGEENPESSDCSGGVCLALAAATGRLIRTTADGLYKKFFVASNPDAGMIQAVFWITQVEKNHGGTIVSPGTAVHVAGVVGRDAVLSAEDPVAVVRSPGSLRLGGCRMETRGLETGTLGNATAHGVDAKFWQYFSEG